MRKKHSCVCLVLHQECSKGKLSMLTMLTTLTSTLLTTLILSPFVSLKFSHKYF